MLIAVAQWLQNLYPEQLGFLRVFQYLTFRAVMAALTALLIGLAFGPWVINRLTDLKFGQPSLLRLNETELLAYCWAFEAHQYIIKAFRLSL